MDLSDPDLVADILSRPPPNPTVLPDSVANTLRALGLNVASDIGNLIAKPRRAMEHGVTTDEAIPWAHNLSLNLLGAGAPMAQTGAVGAAGGRLAKTADESKTYWSDLAKTRHPIPVEDMTATRRDLGQLLPRKVISPEDLHGSILTPAVGDRTAAGSVLTHINEKPLDFGVPLEGGPDFMRGPAAQADNAAWASKKGVVTRLSDHIRQLGEKGDPVNFVYSAMGARSGDQSTMMTDALLAQLGNAKITKKAAAEFDRSMKEQYAPWPGLFDKSGNVKDKARDVLLKGSGELRKTFVHEMALGQHQAAGFPEIGSTRHAISVPDLIGQPTGASGYAVSRLDPAGRVITNPSVPHTTYDTQLGGEGYLGGFEQPIPREVLFPKFYKERRKAGDPPLADDRAFSMSNVSQKADDRWLENVMKYIFKQEGR